ncbi:uncharacterized protein LOC121292827 [Carcharodon carcharias]|uniref:uncharacterized protein LOC121292827 n=1 Tax=Carcharodon carcharias TaxID=13397 RepID=UPI001B7F6107|nr:uncharacterized protein LOC121292827 [Carcharodon carcharias]XP_041071207.1 uncharacterized protein LOC121292827 [Carcharodon carcharias]XP_041071208.1 uncharacterized protein LOC121292827 [Carcharodon carcharias]
MITGVADYQESSPAVHLQQDEKNVNANNFPQNMAECFMKLNSINGNVEISIPLDDCGLDVRNPSMNQNSMEEQDPGEIDKIRRERTVLETHRSFNLEALDPSDSINASLAGYMEDPVSNMKHILNGAELVSVREGLQLNASTNTSKNEESNELWSDFAGYGKASQFCGTFHELSLREKDDFAEKSFQKQSSKSLNGTFMNHHFPIQRHKSTNGKCDNELKASVSIIDACAPKFNMLKLNFSGNAEGELLRGHNPGQSAAFVDDSFIDSAVNWTTFESNGQLDNDTLQIDCSETEFSDFGATGALCPTSSPFSENQEIVSAGSALKADTRNLLEKVFQNSFPSEPMKHSFEDIPTLLKIHGEESDAIKAKTSPEFPSAWEVLQDLNKVSSRSSWNVSHTRQKLLSTLGIDQNQKDIGQGDIWFLEDRMGCRSDLEMLSALPKVTTVTENGTKTLIQTRIPVTPFPRTGRSFTHRLETVFIQWLQVNGNRVRDVPRIKRNSLLL